MFESEVKTLFSVMFQRHLSGWHILMNIFLDYEMLTFFNSSCLKSGNNDFYKLGNGSMSLTVVRFGQLDRKALTL